MANAVGHPSEGGSLCGVRGGRAEFQLHTILAAKFPERLFPQPRQSESREAHNEQDASSASLFLSGLRSENVLTISHSIASNWGHL